MHCPMVANWKTQWSIETLKKWWRIKGDIKGSCFGTLDYVVAADPGSNPVISNFIEQLFTDYCLEKDENKKKEAGGTSYKNLQSHIN